jgi:8-oxo-dGTP diphosphatase
MKLATLCYLRKDGKTLMIHRNKRPDDMHMGKWNGLGGKLEPGETPEECARRELLEESGMAVQNLIYKGLLTFPGFAHEEDWYTFVFVSTELTGDLIDPPEGSLQWIDDEVLLDLNLWEGDRIFLKWLEQPGVFSGKFVYKDGNFIEYSVTFYP